MSHHTDESGALRFITCGSVDDGKSTLIGRLLLDSRAVLQDQLAGVRTAAADGLGLDLARLTDGLTAEREQGITIDVAYRYFSTERRKFIIGDTPGHEQYTRNMITAASGADAAVLLVDATKIDGTAPSLQLLPQTRRHALLVHLLQVPSVVFAVNKLDALTDAATAYGRIRDALLAFGREAGLGEIACVPISALHGWNVVEPRAGWVGYDGPTLLETLESLPTGSAAAEGALHLPVQWVEKFSESQRTDQGRRVFWGRVALGTARVGEAVTVFPSGQTAIVADVLTGTRQAASVAAGCSAGVVLDREVDVSRGDWLLPPGSDAKPQRRIEATVAWMDDERLVPGRTYWALHGHRWVKAKVQQVLHRLDIHTLEQVPSVDMGPNDIGRVTLVLQEPIPTLPYAVSRPLGAMVLVDTATHRTAGALLLEPTDSEGQS